MWSSDHPQEDFAIFGDRSESKVETFRNLAIIWRHAGNYCLNLAISKKNSLIIWRLWAIFFPQKHLCMSHTGLSFVARMQNFAQKMKKAGLAGGPILIVLFCQQLERGKTHAHLPVITTSKYESHSSSRGMPPSVPHLPFKKFITTCV
jgi:hypothetical protein